MAIRALIDDLHEQLKRDGFDDVRPAFGFVLLAARQRELTVNDVAELNGITKQAASKLVSTMEVAGYVTRQPGSEDARVRTLQLTARGTALLTQVEQIYIQLEKAWANEVGTESVAVIRDSLTRLMLQRGKGSLPPVRPSW